MGQLQDILLLIEAGANVDRADRNGVTPLEHARKRGYEESENLLKSVDSGIN